MPNGYMGETQGPFILKLIANMTGLFLWGLCLWFFLISLAAHWQVVQPHHPEHHIHFDITWYVYFPHCSMSHFASSPFSTTYSLHVSCLSSHALVVRFILIIFRNSFIFPNTALITATAQIGKAFQSHAIQIFGTVIAVMLVVVWLGVLFLLVRALVLRRILWPGDVDSTQTRREGLV
jgi:hypothetical protein